MRYLKLTIATITLVFISITLFPLSLICKAIIWLFDKSIKDLKEFTDSI